MAPRCSPQGLQAALQLVNIQTLAFTPPHSLPWRVYLYTHTCCEAAPSSLVLGELLCAAGADHVAVTLRQQPRDDKALTEFLSVLSAVLLTLTPPPTGSVSS